MEPFSRIEWNIPQWWPLSLPEDWGLVRTGFAENCVLQCPCLRASVQYSYSKQHPWELYDNNGENLSAPLSIYFKHEYYQLKTILTTEIYKQDVTSHKEVTEKITLSYFEFKLEDYHCGLCLFLSLSLFVCFFLKIVLVTRVSS